MDLPSRGKAFDHVRGFDGDVGVGDHEQPGVVVEAVEDLDAAAVGELPVGAVGLPELVGQLGLEADERGSRPLVRLRSDQPVAGEDAPDRRHRRRAADLEAEMVGDRVWAAVVAGVSKLPSQANDRGLNLGRGCVGAGAWSSRAWLQGGIAALAEPRDQLVEPISRDPVRLGDLRGASPLEQHRIDHIAPQSHSQHPRRTWVSTMS